MKEILYMAIAVSLAGCAISPEGINRMQKLGTGIHRVGTPGRQDQNQGSMVYSADECIGPVIAGRCEGSILPHGGHHETCYGEMLNGICTGPMF